MPEQEIYRFIIFHIKDLNLEYKNSFTKLAIIFGRYHRYSPSQSALANQYFLIWKLLITKNDLIWFPKRNLFHHRDSNGRLSIIYSLSLTGDLSKK